MDLYLQGASVVVEKAAWPQTILKRWHKVRTIEMYKQNAEAPELGAIKGGWEVSEEAHNVPGHWKKMARWQKIQWRVGMGRCLGHPRIQRAQERTQNIKCDLFSLPREKTRSSIWPTYSSTILTWILGLFLITITLSSSFYKHFLKTFLWLSTIPCVYILRIMSSHLWGSIVMGEKRMYTCMCNWDSMPYSRKKIVLGK